MQNFSHQGPTMLNLPHDIITAVPGQEHGRTQDSALQEASQWHDLHMISSRDNSAQKAHDV